MPLANKVRRKVSALLLIALLGAFGEMPAFASELHTFNIESTEAATAIHDFGNQSNVQILVDSQALRGKHLNSVRGERTVDEGLRLLLADSGLTHRYVSNRSVALVAAEQSHADTTIAPGLWSRIRLAQAETAATANRDEDASAAKKPIELEEVVVIGTNIRGAAPSSSPVDIYTSEDIRRSGALTTEQFIQKLPQNLASKTSTAPLSGTASNQVVNDVDLRGLGAGTTLVLLNGRRLALATAGVAPDISTIPASAIKRVEVLTDGASAIYGSDAIGGVVNFVLRDDFEGSETTLGYAAVTDGEFHQSHAAQTFGHNWGSGHALVSYDYLAAKPLQTADRDYARAAGAGYLTPDDRRNNFLATASQSLGERLVLNADFLLSRRDLAFNVTIPEFFHRDGQREKQYFTNVGVDYAFGNGLHASLLATWSKNDTDIDIYATRLSTGVPTITTSFQDYAAMDLTAKLDGELFSLPDGAVRFSIGAGQTTERYASQTATNRRAIDYGFGELLVPLVGAARGVPFVHRLELSLAARYTEYEDRSHPRTETDFGGETSPKVGLLWSPINGLALRGTYGESFRAANLTQISRARSTTNIARFPTTLNNRPFLLISGGPAGTLTPEKATSYTAGFDLKPTALPALHLSGTYFDISYEDRIGLSANPTSLALINPAAYPEAVFFSPTVEQIEEALRHSRVTLNNLGVDTSDPHAAAVLLAAMPNFVFADNRQRNLAVSKQHGMDLSSGYSFGTALGRVSTDVQVTYIFDYVQQATPSSPTLSMVSSVLLPVKLRGRASVGLSRGAFDGMLNVNYIDDYANPYAVGGSKPVASWTTLDLTAAYELGTKYSDLLHGLRFSLSVQNLLDREPPHVGISTGQALTNAIGFDPVNANPLGRLVSLEISKQFGGARE